MTSLASELKRRGITLPTKIRTKLFFLVVMYGCESWTIKKSERRKTLDSPLDGREIKPVSPEEN